MKDVQEQIMAEIVQPNLSRDAHDLLMESAGREIKKLEEKVENLQRVVRALVFISNKGGGIEEALARTERDCDIWWEEVEFE